MKLAKLELHSVSLHIYISINFQSSLLSEPTYVGPLTLIRFRPFSKEGGSLEYFPNSCFNLSFLWCSRCLIVASSFPNFLYLMEMGRLLLPYLSFKVFAGDSLQLEARLVLRFGSSFLEQSDDIDCPLLLSCWSFFNRLSPF